MFYRLNSNKTCIIVSQQELNIKWFYQNSLSLRTIELKGIGPLFMFHGIPCFTIKSAFYPQFCVLSPIPCFIPNATFYPQFCVLSPIPHFITNSAFYLQFCVLSPIPRFTPHSAFYPRFRFRIPVPYSGSAFYPYPVSRWRPQGRWLTDQHRNSQNKAGNSNIINN